MLASAASDAAWLSGHDLKRHCEAFAADPTSGEASACVAFVQGVLAASEPRGEPPGAAFANSSAVQFSERAARTRGAARLSAMLAEHTRFCIGGDIAPEEILARVSAYLSSIDAADYALSEPAEHVVQRALVDSFPCGGG
jgi:hypothetical protein